MKLKQMMLFGVMLQAISPVHASDLLTNLNTTTASLLTAQTALATLLGISNSSETFVPTTSTITNNSKDTVYLVMLNQAKQQVNPNVISLEPDKFSYVPGNVTSIQIVNQSKKQLVAAMPLTVNALYSITNTNDNWKMAMLPTEVAYNYKNSTMLPIVLTMTTDNMQVTMQKVAPGAVYTSEAMDPTTEVQICAHASISAICAPYNPSMAYNITIDANNALTLTPVTTAQVQKTISNNSGYPMLLHVQNSDKTTNDDIILEPGMNYNPSEKIVYGVNIMIIPMISNYNDKNANVVKSGSIVNNKGHLDLQF